MQHIASDFPVVVMPAAMSSLSILAVYSNNPLHKIAEADYINKIGDILIYVIRCNVLHQENGDILFRHTFLANGNRGVLCTQVREVLKGITETSSQASRLLIPDGFHKQGSRACR